MYMMKGEGKGGRKSRLMLKTVFDKLGKKQVD